MKRLTLMLIGSLLIAPGGVIAQVTERPAEDTRVAADPVRPLAEPTATTGSFSESSAAAQQKPLQPPPPPPADRRRRRGSMVGYIENPIVESKLRIRFDRGLQNNVPDRAEFFYAKCGCYQDAVGHPNHDPEAPGPLPNIVTDLNFQQLYIEGEYSITPLFSAFAEFPLRWIQPQAFAAPDEAGNLQPVPSGPPNRGGFGDLRAGVRFALVATSEQAVTVQLRAFLPTGKASSGLGTDHASLEPALLVYQRVSDRLAVEAQVGDWHPFGGSAGLPADVDDKFSGDVFFYGIGPSYEVYRSDRVRFAPVIELVGWRVLGGFQTGAAREDASGTNIVNLKIGARIGWDIQNSLYVGYGHALTTASWYDDIVRFEYRYSF